MPCDDCSTDDLCRCGPGETCGHCFESRDTEPECQHLDKYNYGLASGPPAIRYFYCPACKAKWEEPEEPPLTPEEEEQAPPDRIHPADCVREDGCPYLEPTCENGCKAAADELVREASKNGCEDCLRGAHGPNAHREEPPPPQPERRPPYAVAYSVQGHLYEVALPGDAVVQAVDGALVIQHDMAPVAGIVQVRPLSSKGQG